MLSDQNQWRAQVDRRLVELEAQLALLRRHQDSTPVIHVRSMGNVANRMIQYMAALALQARFPAARVANIDLHEWGIVEPSIEIREPAWRIPTNRVNLDEVQRLVTAERAQDVVLLNFLQHVANFLPPDYYRTVFGRRRPPAHVFGHDVIVISLRMNEVLSGFYPFYNLLPVDFYRDVVRQTGLRPVFFGQLTPSPYLDALRAAFPDAEFIAGREPMEDFEVLRSAPNLCLSISTFAWTAGFLSEAKKIVIPVNGLLSPFACASYGDDHDLVPRADPRYNYWFFPVNYAVSGASVLDYHAELSGRWRLLPADEAVACLDGHRRAPRRIADYLALFDADYYLRAHREIGEAVAEGRIGQADHHYTLHGFDENRTCFPLDVPFYARRYPDAADAVGFGRYRDFHHFHVCVGAALGYLTTPPASERLAA